ncbi:MAG: hypothetical protein MUF23_10545 [Pirellula sp.]|nr:hypothetical protein [Pirellula sp.]
MAPSTSCHKLRRIVAPLAWVVCLASISTGLSAMGLQGWERYREMADRSNVEKLNQMVAEYQQRTGRIPDMNLIELFRAGISHKRLHDTPYGGTYQIDPVRRMVYNPHRPHN